MFKRLTKLPKNRQYNYQPRFWNPKKEELEERLKKAELRRTGKGGDKEAIKARISTGLKRGYLADSSYRKKKVLRSNMVLIGIIVMLVILAYYGLTVYLPKMLDALNLQN
jgi:hypothetical protein